MPHALTNKNQAAILRALAETGLKPVAEALHIDESTVSRMKEPGGQIGKFAAMAAVLGLKLVRADEETYKPEVMQALHTLAALALEVSPELVVLKAEKS